MTAADTFATAARYNIYSCNYSSCGASKIGRPVLEAMLSVL